MCEKRFSPRDVNFFVFIIFAANSSPVDFWTHRFTIENAPLREKKENNKKNCNKATKKM